MRVEASAVSETTKQDASASGSCVQRKFVPAPIWTEAMWQLYKPELRVANSFFADLGLFTMCEAHRLACQSR